MRTMISAAIFLSLTGLAIAGDAGAAVRKNTHIPAQALEQALRELAKARDVQFIFVAEDVKGRRTQEVRGELTQIEALDALLEGTDLTYVQIDEETISILPRTMLLNGTPQAFNRAHQHGPSGDMERVRLAGADARTAQGGGEDSDREPRATSQPAQSTSRYELEEVAVTGTRIRDEQASASPLFSYDRDDFAAMGATSAQQVLRSLPQNFTGGPSEIGGALSSSRNGQSYSIAFGASVNLRGVGAESTLVLLDGRRIAPGGLGSFTDLSSIPLSAIERIDVVPDGASAIYGSDAVGGVVNFILRDKFEGAESQVRYGEVSDGSMSQFNASQTFGKAWQSGAVLVNAEYARTEPLLATERSYATGLQAGVSYLSPQDERFSVLIDGHQDLTASLILSTTLYAGRREPLTQNYQATRARQLVSGATLDHYGGTLALDWQASESWLFTLAQTLSYNDSERDNYIGPGTATPASYTRVGGESQYVATEMEAEGALFRLPGGDARLALGAERRFEKLDVVRINVTGPRSVIDRETLAGYAELFVPLISNDNAMRFARSVSFTAAGRYEDYEDVGAQDTYKVGALWSPIDDLTFRGTYGTSFRAAYLYQYDSSASAGVIYDVPNGAGTTRIAAVSQAPHPDLGPEYATTWTAGFDVGADLLGLRISGTYYEIDYDDRIAAPGFRSTAFSTPMLLPYISMPADPGIMALLPNVAQFFNTTSGGLDTVAATFDGRIQNIASTKVAGIDLTIGTHFDTPVGQISLDLNGNRLLSFEVQQTAAAPVIDISSTIFNPVDLRLRAGVAWRMGGWSASSFLNYTDSYVDNQVPTELVEVSSWTTVDFGVAYQFGKRGGLLGGLTLRANAINAFDRDPPRITDRGSAFGSPGFDTENANPYGRIVSLEISKSW